jgi:serine/threonine protein kinase
VLCLIDFELAISREEAIKGISREYASPEQFRMLDYLKTIPEDANLKNIPANILLDGKTDLYSAGLILYQLLTKNVWQTNKVLPGKINRHIPKKVEEIIINLLKDTPSERISSAEELKKHLLNSMI